LTRIIIRGAPVAANYYDVIADGDAHGDGSTDDRQHILDAVTAYKNGGYDGLYFPEADYLLSTALTVPSNTVLVGSGMTTAWLQGQVIFSSADSFTDLKIGPVSVTDNLTGLKSVDGADGTTFTRCHFRGGSNTDGNNAMVMKLGGGNDVTNVTWTDCEFERSLATTYPDVTSDTIYMSAWGGILEDFLFDGCHFGVTNGTETGAAKMHFELQAGHSGTDHWTNMTFTGCEFEPSNYHALDFAAYADSGASGGVLVEDCIFHGAGVDPTMLVLHDWGYGICLETPTDAIIRNNHFHRCYNTAIYDAYNYGQLQPAGGWTITGNTFDWDTTEKEIVPYYNVINIAAADSTITGNTFNCHSNFTFAGGRACVNFRISTAGEPWNTTRVATGNVLTGNTFNLDTDYPVVAKNGTGVDADENGQATWLTDNTVVRT